MESYTKLMERVKEITLIGTATGFLNWDMLTYMPPRGAQLRGEQLGAMTRIIQRMQTSPEYADLLLRSEKEVDDSNALESRNLKILRKNYEVARSLPEDLVAEIAKQRAISNQAWGKARSESKWKIFEPELEKTFELSKKAAELTMDAKGASTLYDSLLDDFEPGMNSEQVASAFSELRKGLVPLVRDLTEKCSKLERSKISKSIPKEIQKKVVLDVADTIGFDTTSATSGARIDEAAHPFTMGYFDDLRITTRYIEDNPLVAVAALMHEAGHGIYEQSFNPDWMFQPIGTMASLGIHESISRFYENMVGRSKEFWTYYLPRFNDLTDGAFRDISIDELMPLINNVGPSKIRVEADEVTYSLHVIIRFEIEQALFNGEIEIKELPLIWNEKYSEYLGVNIETDAEGVLQDSHWSAGMFGYFPTYALGNLYNGMWYHKMSQDRPSWKQDLQEGIIDTAYSWLKENVMYKANLYDPSDLVYDVTGQKLTGKPFLNYLEDKYSAIF
ncbi:MAG: carboxypeptidase M32 [Candidatus Thorarchaeota archaeon]